MSHFERESVRPSSMWIKYDMDLSCYGLTDLSYEENCWTLQQCGLIDGYVLQGKWSNPLTRGSIDGSDIRIVREIVGSPYNMD